MMRGYLQALVARSSGGLEVVAPRPVSVFESSPSWLASGPDDHPGRTDPIASDSAVTADPPTESASQPEDVPVRLHPENGIRSGRAGPSSAESIDEESPPHRHEAVRARPVAAPSVAPAGLPTDHGAAPGEQAETLGTDPQAMAGSARASRERNSRVRPALRSGGSSDAEPLSADEDAVEPESGRRDTHQTTTGRLRPAEAEPRQPKPASTWQRRAPLYPSMNDHWTAAAMPAPGDNRKEEKTVHVSIGRIEVRLSPPPQPQPNARPTKNREPAMTLDRYLHRRGGGKR
jgi:hypothetical protein